ncbi:MAG: aminotransferase class III-fold pyridoxal phosphate-dependent enzyme [Pseudomonadota bacterium]
MRNIEIDDALSEARSSYAAKRPQSFAIHAEAVQHLPGGNTRTVLFHGPFPFRAARGEGALLYDHDGHALVNLLGEYTAGVFGHSHPAIVRALHRAIDGGLNLGANTQTEAEFARQVVARFPAMERVRFTNSGTEANLLAIATARYATGRDKVMVFAGGYHGGVLYFGGGGSPINAPFHYLTAPFNDGEAACAMIRQAGDSLACVIVEPMLGASGALPAADGFLRALREATLETGALLIFDEVMTSRFGRSGAGALHGVRPDLMTLGKWVGGGMSFGAFGGAAHLMDLYDPARADALPHAGTFNNNTLTMHAGIAALSEAFTPDIAEDLHRRGEVLRERLNGICRSADVALSFTGEGSLLALHGTARPIRTPRDLIHSDDRLKELVFFDLLDRGYYIARRGFMALSVALTDAQLNGFADAFQDIVAVRQPMLSPLASAA